MFTISRMSRTLVSSTGKAFSSAPQPMPALHNSKTAQKVGGFYESRKRLLPKSDESAAKGELSMRLSFSNLQSSAAHLGLLPFNKFCDSAPYKNSTMTLEQKEQCFRLYVESAIHRVNNPPENNPAEAF